MKRKRVTTHTPKGSCLRGLVCRHASPRSPVQARMKQTWLRPARGPRNRRGETDCRRDKSCVSKKGKLVEAGGSAQAEQKGDVDWAARRPFRDHLVTESGGGGVGWTFLGRTVEIKRETAP